MRGEKKRRNWPVAVIGLGLLTAGAWFASKPALEDRLAQQVGQALGKAGIADVQVSVRGRDVALKGVATSSVALRKAERTALSVRGVRRVDVAGLGVVPAAPTVGSVNATEPPVEITGTWPQAEGQGLRVLIGQRSWTLGKDPALTSENGRWRLRLDELPPPGEHDVVVEVIDGQARARDASSGELRVKARPKPPPVPPPAPTVAKLLSNSATPKITGRLVAPHRVKKLKVVLAGKTYEEGDGHLTRAGDAWKLVPAAPLPEGVHDVQVIAIGEGGASSTDATKGEVVIDLTPPATPALEQPVVIGRQVILRGSWAEGDARLLRAVVGNDKFDLGDPGSPLMRDGDGRFKLMLPASRLPELRKVRLLVIDAAGNVSETTLSPQAANSCQQRLNDVLIQDMIHFTTGSADISDDSLLLLDKLAEVLMGCPDMEVLIVGHTDDVGDLNSNQQLSEARANAVKTALVQRGLPAERIIARGEGETQPLVPNDSDRNRQINRRIEITVRPRGQE